MQKCVRIKKKYVIVECDNGATISGCLIIINPHTPISQRSGCVNEATAPIFTTASWYIFIV